MSKEIYISSTPHETRLAIVEDDAVSEIYYERENEYTLAGSIYNGRVTRVLPGMQSAFVDVGLERDAFLYITDFMEEVPDSAEFETSNGSEQRAPRAGAADTAEADRGNRGRRGSRDRNNNRGDRSDRTDPGTQRANTYAEPSEDQSIGSESYAASGADYSEAQTGESSLEGSRRWRGRRGRRRGRTGLPGTPEATQSAAPFTLENTEAESDDETLFEGGASLDDTPPFDLEATAEAPVTQQPETTERRPDGERGRFDRNRRRSGSRRSDERLSETQDQRASGRPDPRQERREGGRSSQRPQRIPRGFSPSRSLYGVDDAEALSSAPAGEPIILPGESLSKYRKPGEEPASAPPPAARAATVNLAAPANLVEVAAGWDGGDVLPGETLSRRRPADPRASRQDLHRTASFAPAPPIEPTPPPVPESAAPAETPAPATEPEPAVAFEEALPQFQSTPEPVEQQASEAVAPVAAAPEPVDYEPVEGSVSYRVDPVAPAEFRQSSPVLEEPIDSMPDLSEEAPAADVHTSLTHTITPAPGEPLEPISADIRAPEIAPVESEQPQDRLETDTPANGTPVTASAPAETSPVPPHDITSISASGEMQSHVETFEPSTTAEVAEPESEGFSPGSGVLAEEVLDEEEPVGTTIQASSFEELDDLEEETLEGTADLGSMLRDMSIDQITRTTPEVPEDLEDFEEDELDEDHQEEIQEEAGLHEHDSLEAPAPEAEAEMPHVYEPPYSAEANPVYEADSQPSEIYPDPNRQYDRGRRDRRDSRRGSRDRRPGGSNDRGSRGRHSVQATNLPAISDLLKPGQEILVQIAKEPIAKKGARITSHIALPGRFLVFMPTVNHTGVSRKIESDSERRRLKEILLSEKGEASGGFIVRTAASGASEEELRSDLRFLLNLWSDIKTRSESSKSPALIYHDLNLIERILRDQVTDNFSAIWVDSETEYERVLRFLQRFQPSLIRRVKLYLKDTPLFEQFGISEEINKALRSKVWLKSGGSIVINQTEALVAIDINTGKYVGKTARLEDTIVKTNLDAIPEIVRQIRLRDLGGIIIIDFIDMDERKNRNRVMAALEEELKKDRAPSKVLQFNDFGLVAITRKRVKQSLERTLSTPCNVCQGTGMVKSPITVCNDIYVEMRKMHKHLDRGDVMLRVHPEVVKQLKASNARWLHEMEEMAGKTILVKSDPSLHPEQFDIH